jgi:hypothetical protein
MMKIFWGLGLSLQNNHHIYVYDKWVNPNVCKVILVLEDGSTTLYGENTTFQECVEWILQTQQSSTLEGYPEHDLSYRAHLIAELHQAILSCKSKED